MKEKELSGYNREERAMSQEERTVIREERPLSPAVALMKNVYVWMTISLALTGFTALFVAGNETMIHWIYGTPTVFFGLLIAELALVFGLSAALQEISFRTAVWLFALYSVINGATLSCIFPLYTSSSIASTFFVTAGTFGVMAFFGHTTRSDLSSLGQLFLMGLVGLIIATVVNIFWANDTLYWIITYAGVFLFVGLTAYDAQKIKALLTNAGELSENDLRKLALMGSLELYLDFVNLFLYLLRVLGKKK